MVIAIIAVLVGILLPAIGKARQAGRQIVCVSNFRQFGLGSAAYSNDNDDRIPTYWWKPGLRIDTGYPDLQLLDERFSVASQGVFLLRELTGDATIPTQSNWTPMMLYGHLPMLDYLGVTIFDDDVTVCPADQQRLELRADTPVDGAFVRSRYQTSFDVIPQLWSRDQSVGGRDTVEQFDGRFAELYRNMNFPGRDGWIASRRTTEVSYPAQKVHAYDTHQRHAGRPFLYHAVPDARVPLLLFDGSAAVRLTSDANPGFQPNDPENPEPTTYWHLPAASVGDVQTPGGDRVSGYYRWTRGGLRGIDFGGREINTGQPAGP